MVKIVRSNFGKRRGRHWPGVVMALAAGIALTLAAEPMLRKFAPASMPSVSPLPTVTRLQTSTALVPRKAVVVDGDTVRFQSTRYRLVGFNTPESGENARCAAERARAFQAKERLRQLLMSRDAVLRRVSCACARGTEEGTPSCNYGRLCAVLTVGGVDAARTLIAEGLAEPCFDRCVRRRNWCG